MTAETMPEWMIGLEEPPGEDLPPEFAPAPVAPPAPDAPVTGGGAGSEPAPGGRALLNDVRDWFGRFVRTMTPSDLDLLALWAVHSHVATECYTTPRLQLDSPMPGSGKSTVLDHLSRLCVNPVQMASVSSPALLGRMFINGPRTLLIDEIDRSLDPKSPGAPDIVAILNSGYRVGASRPVLVQTGKDWDMVEMSTFGPVAMAGNSPALPDDTRSRCIRVVLLPDLEGVIEDSDWELIEEEAEALGARIAAWANSVRLQIRAARPDLPSGIIGRNKEKWRPLARVAHVAGGGWPAAVEELALLDLEEQKRDREDGLAKEAPAVALLRHIAEQWPGDAPFATTSQLMEDLARNYPDQWGLSSPFGKPITAQRLGRMLAQAFKVHSTRLRKDGPRGYALATLSPAMRRMGVGVTGETGATGGTGATGTCNCSDAVHGIHRPTCRAAS